MRAATYERAAALCKRRRLEDKGRAWKAKQGTEAPESLGGRDAFLK